MMFWGHNRLNSGPDGETRFNVREALDHNAKIIVVGRARPNRRGAPTCGCRFGPAWLQLIWRILVKGNKSR